MPGVAMSPSGAFVIVWHSKQSGDDIYAQLYNSSGSAVGSEFRINVTTTNIQDQPGAAMDSSGNFVVTWRSVAQDLSGSGVYARRFNSSGTALSGEFAVNNITNGNQDKPNISM